MNKKSEVEKLKAEVERLKRGLKIQKINFVNFKEKKL
jgi:hypothetical protein